MRAHVIKPKLSKKLNKLSKRDSKTYEIVLKKIQEICNSYDVDHYKNLRNELRKEKRVHIGHFVLTFEYEISDDLIIFLDFDHHDKIYEK